MFEESVKRYLKGYKSDDPWSMEDGYILLGASQLYEVTGEGFYKDFVLTYMEQNISSDGVIHNCKEDDFLSVMQCGKSLITAYRWTENKKYKLAIGELVVKLSSQPRTPEHLFTQPDRGELSDNIEVLYKVEPFYMAYETFLGKKENYNDIINQFKAARAIMNSAKTTVLDTYNYSMALVDTVSVTSEQIFEHYKQLEVQLKEAIKVMLPYGDELDIAAGYVILKACNQGHLLREKYEHKGEKIVKKYLEKDLPADKKQIGIYMMAYAQLLKSGDGQSAGIYEA